MSEPLRPNLDIDPRVFGVRLQEARKDRRLTQQDAAGALTEEALQGPEEDAPFVGLGAALADGEAEAAALAVSRGYVPADDDRKARRLVTERHPGARLTSTLELLRAWQLAAQPSDAEVAATLRRIAERAAYRPRRVHPLYASWKGLAGE